MKEILSMEGLKHLANMVGIKIFLAAKVVLKKTRNLHFHQKMNKYFCDITTR